MRLLKAQHRFKRICDIKSAWLVEKNIEAIILDVDNTLTEHGSQKLEDNVAAWIAEMQACGMKLIILSNNRDRRVKPFAEKIGLKYIANGMKPLKIGISKALKELGTDHSKVVMIGDQVFTDVLGGNIAGIRTVRLEPISREKGRFMRLKRKLEKHVD
ncbi:MAG: YqeG family HAD IIIA-type phosphatase [Ruminococcaceae bacterium]|nr:YqeG family HAD IIIA-type phosphatase [Oscillospiraceae bacterium]